MNLYALNIAVSSSVGILLLYAILCWYYRRNVPFFKVRSPLLMTLSQVYSYGTVVATLTLLDDESCLMMAIFFSLLLPFSMGPMLMMIPQFLLNAKVNGEKINRSKGIINQIWKYKFLTRTDVQAAIIVTIALIHVGFYFLFSHFFTLEDNCYRMPLLLFDIEMIMYFIPYGWLMHKIKGIQDSFYIRNQLVLSWIVTSPITIITVLYPFVLYPYFDFRYVYMSSAAAMFLIMYILPLFYFPKRRIIRSSSSDFTLYTFNRSYEELLTASEKTWSSENILFIRAVQEFKEIPTSAKANEIYNLYIKSNADMWINISHAVSSKIEKVILDQEIVFDPDFFEDAEREIMYLIKTNILPYI